MGKMDLTCLIGILLVVTLSSVHARPQNDMVEADGFVFDGPADRPDFPNTNGRTPPPSFPPFDDPTIRPSPGNPSGTTTSTPGPDITQCMQNCPVTGQYNPVCGSDNVVYSNMGRLDCANSCGIRKYFYYKCPEDIVDCIKPHLSRLVPSF